MMNALIFDPNGRRGLRFGEIAEPTPTAAQALVEVHAISFNWGELRFLDHMHKPGDVPGWDAAGVVVRAAADGSGPASGTHVTTAGWNGAWGELRAVDTRELAPIPNDMDFGVASALPAAGVTALRALRSLGSVAGRRVLVTGASGGVGSFAVQLARRAGAHVVASVSGEGRGETLRKLGAREVVIGLDSIIEPFHGVLDNVGGSVLTGAFKLVAPGGTLVSIGNASLETSTIDFEQERSRGGDRRIEVFTVGGAGYGPDLSYLVELVSLAELHPRIGWRGDWRQAAEAADALLERRVRGKVVLDLQRDEWRSPGNEDPAILVLRRASVAIAPNVSPFRAIWDQWESQGKLPDDRWVYVKAETALKQALAELGETNVPEFAQSRDLPRYAAAVSRAIHGADRRGSTIITDPCPKPPVEY